MGGENLGATGKRGPLIKKLPLVIIIGKWKPSFVHRFVGKFLSGHRQLMWEIPRFVVKSREVKAVRGYLRPWARDHRLPPSRRGGESPPVGARVVTKKRENRQSGLQR